MTLTKRAGRPTLTADARELERRLFAAGEGPHQARLRLCRAREVVRDAEQALLAARCALESAALEAAARAELLEGLQTERVRLATREVGKRMPKPSQLGAEAMDGCST